MAYIGNLNLNKLSPKILKHIKENLPDKKLLFIHLAGSRLYGTNSQESDWDVKGICLSPDDYWVGGKSFNSYEFQGEIEGVKTDIAIWDIRHLLKNVVRTGPTSIETLFINNSDYVIYQHNYWFYLKAHILKLLNRSVYDAFKGYGTSQVKKFEYWASEKDIREDKIFKFLMHGFRLASEGREILETGKITFPCYNRSELLDIKLGKTYPIDQWQRAIDDWKIQNQLLDEALVNSPLPNKFDFIEYNNLLKDIFYKYL